MNLYKYRVEFVRNGKISIPEEDFYKVQNKKSAKCKTEAVQTEKKWIRKAYFVQFLMNKF